MEERNVRYPLGAENHYRAHKGQSQPWHDEEQVPVWGSACIKDCHVVHRTRMPWSADGSNLPLSIKATIAGKPTIGMQGSPTLARRRPFFPFPKLRSNLRQIKPASPPHCYRRGFRNPDRSTAWPPPNPQRNPRSSALAVMTSSGGLPIGFMI